MRYKIDENIKEKNSVGNLYSEPTHALLKNIIHVVNDLNEKLTNMYNNDAEATNIKKLMNMFFVHIKMDLI